jgi:hypothetical protein
MELGHVLSVLEFSYSLFPNVFFLNDMEIFSFGAE